MEEKRRKRDRTYYLNSSADMLSRQVYEMCRKQTKSKEEKDVKNIKELCGVLKETVNISLSLEKSDSGERDSLFITFDDDALLMSE